jgi:predicted nucleic acid-binding protein
MIEYQATMIRPEHREASGLSAADIEVLLDAVAAIAEPARLAFLWRPALRDPDDDLVLETAVNGLADAVMPFNTCDFVSIAARFALEVLTPGEAWKRWEAKP